MNHMTRRIHQTIGQTIAIRMIMMIHMTIH